MTIREKILKMAVNDEEALMLARIYDFASNAQKNYCFKATPFLNGRELMLAEKIANMMGVPFKAFGGYDEAERKQIIFHPDFSEVYDEDFPIKAIEITGYEISSLTHRDYLGSILGLGITREKVGDIIINEKGAVVFAEKAISSFIVTQLERIGRKAVKIKETDFDCIKIPLKRFTEKNVFTSSLRLDCVLSAVTGMSRSESSSLIKSKNVNINWECIEDTSYTVKENSLLSARGYGRIEILNVEGTTKKGRIVLSVKKYV